MQCVIPESSIGKEANQIFAATYVALSCFGVFGNSISLICLSKLHTNGNFSNIILMYLVMSDLYVSLIGMPLIYIGFATGSRDCVYHNIVAFANILGILTSSTAVLVLAFERYILLTKPQKYGESMSRKKIHITMISLWSIIVFGTSSRFILPAITFVILLVINLTVIIALPISYSKIISRLKGVSNNVTRHQQPSSQTGNTNSVNKKVTFKVMLIILGYYITFVPFSILNIPYALGKMNSLLILVQGSITLMLLNCCVNPIIYFATDKRVRTQFLIVFLRRRRNDRNDQFSTSSQGTVPLSDRITQSPRTKVNRNDCIPKLLPTRIVAGDHPLPRTSTKEDDPCLPTRQNKNDHIQQIPETVDTENDCDDLNDPSLERRTNSNDPSPSAPRTSTNTNDHIQQLPGIIETVH